MGRKEIHDIYLDGNCRKKGCKAETARRCETGVPEGAAAGKEE